MSVKTSSRPLSDHFALSSNNTCSGGGNRGHGRSGNGSRCIGSGKKVIVFSINRELESVWSDLMSWEPSPTLGSYLNELLKGGSPGQS